MIQKPHFRCSCGGIFTQLVQPNLQNIIFRENSVLEQHILYCRRLHSTVCTHCRTGVREGAGGSVVASESSVESQSIANARQRAVTSAIDRNCQLANPSAQLPRGTERSRCSGGRWSRGNPGSAPQIPVWAGCRRRSRQQFRQGL